MPRKGPAPRRELMPDPIYRSVRRHPARQQDPAARQALHRREDRLRRARRSSSSKTGAEPIATLKRAVDNVKPQLEVQEPPRRRRHLPGAGRGAAPAGQHPRHPLDRRLLPPAPREDHGRAPRQRAARRQQRPRRLDQAQGRPAQDGRVQQGLRALPLVAAPPALPAASVAPPTAGRVARDDRRSAPARRSPTTPRPTGLKRWPKSPVTRSSAPATSGSWPTSTPARPPRPSGSSTTPARPTRSARSTRARAVMDWMVQEQERGITITSRRHHLRVARPPDQHHRHPRPRRLHRRGRALAARARRRGRGVRRRRRRRAPDRDGLAPGQQVQRPAHLLRQQDGPPRRRLLRRRRLDPGPPRGQHRRRPAADRRRGRLQGRRRPGHHEGARLARRGAGRQVGGPARSPPTCSDDAEEWRARADRRRRARRRDRPREVRRRGGDHRRRPPATPSARPPSPARSSRCCAARAFKNKGVQPLLDAVVDYLPSPLDLPPVAGHRPQGRRADVERKPTTTSRSRRWRSRS